MAIVYVLVMRNMEEEGKMEKKGMVLLFLEEGK